MKSLLFNIFWKSVILPFVQMWILPPSGSNGTVEQMTGAPGKWHTRQPWTGYPICMHTVYKMTDMYEAHLSIPEGDLKHQENCSNEQNSARNSSSHGLWQSEMLNRHPISMKKIAAFIRSHEEKNNLVKMKN